MSFLLPYCTYLKKKISTAYIFLDKLHRTIHALIHLAFPLTVYLKAHYARMQINSALYIILLT